MNKKELHEALDFSLELAEKAGNLLLKYQKQLGKLRIKLKDAQGVATKADLESEALIVKAIAKKYPTHKILAEESAFAFFKEQKDRNNIYAPFSDAKWCWVIDPLDGTNNFLNAFDYYAVCISLAHFGRPVLGIVLRPGTGEVFYALKGEGAKYRPSFAKRAKHLAKISGKSRLKDALLVTGFVSEKGVYFEQEFSFFKEMMKHCRGIRRTGSAALDLCYVASGVWDGFWERGLAPWDLAAAGFICVEAKVEVTDFNGQKFDPFANSIMALRRPLYKEFFRLF